jgi:hypothetical protein
MLARRIAAAIAFGSMLLCAEDFTLKQNGIGPITVHTTLTFDGQGERLLAVAVNDSGQLISHVRFCVAAGLEACLFGLEVAEPWQPGKTVRWNLTAIQHTADLSHYVRIVALTVATPQQEMGIPDAKPTVEVRAAQVASPQPAAEILSNETILRLVKAGLGEEVIIGMVSSQKGKYSVDTDSVIALRQAGVSNNIIAAMVSKNSVSGEQVPRETQLPKPSSPEQPPPSSALDIAPPKPTTTSVGDSALARTVHPWARVFIAPMEGGLDGFIPPEIRKQKVPVTLVLDEKDADYILAGSSGDAGSRWYDVIAAGPLWGKDKFEGNVRLISVQYKSLVWAGEAGDRSILFGGFRRGGQRKVAERIVKEMGRDLFKP